LGRASHEPRIKVMRRRGLIALLALCGIAVPVAYAVIPRHAPPKACSSLSCVLHVAPGGSDGAPCSTLRPCRTFDRAYRAARPGQVVELAAGRYRAQKIRPDDSKVSRRDVVFQPARGAHVIVDDLQVYGSHIEFRNLTLANTWATYVQTNDVTFRNLSASYFVISSSQNISVIGGSYGPAVDTKSQVQPAPQNVQPLNITIDGAIFHDYTRRDPRSHMECLQFGAGKGIVVRNSRFTNCNDFDLMMGIWGSVPDPSNITIENNFFDISTEAVSDCGGAPCTAYYSMMTDGWQNLTIRNNAFAMPWTFGSTNGNYQNVKVIGNVGPFQSWRCDKRVHYSHNLWQGTRCGPTDKNVDKRQVTAALRRWSPTRSRG
jgi:hypothetical protein